MCRLPEKGRKEIEESRGDEREGQGRKRNRNESEETEEIKTFPLYPYPLQGQMENWTLIWHLLNWYNKKLTGFLHVSVYIQNIRFLINILINQYLYFLIQKGDTFNILRICLCNAFHHANILLDLTDCFRSSTSLRRTLVPWCF